METLTKIFRGIRIPYCESAFFSKEKLWELLQNLARKNRPEREKRITSMDFVGAPLFHFLSLKILFEVAGTSSKGAARGTIQSRTFQRKDGKKNVRLRIFKPFQRTVSRKL
ncbi:hypothetical protein DLM75_14835 [Leptospira stimsonii]|uniref:Uncharacterized protein n=1 Tax=Leptospira stimsonii TaxID=2202203 RepID=A0A396Z0T8_9LEPT|nr:hypothetical protein DLM75_14835 [Leptospira stimsonii]